MYNLPSNETFVAKTVDWLTCPYWECLENHLHQLVFELPSDGLLAHRSTLLSWIYQENGVITFADLIKRVKLDKSNHSHSRRGLRCTLKGMHRINLINIVTPKSCTQGDQDKDKEDDDSDTASSNPSTEVIIAGKSRIFLTWAGMVWIRRSWTARFALMQRSPLLEVHNHICSEEDEGRSVDPYWVENLFNSPKEDSFPSISVAKDPFKKVNFVFDLGAASTAGKRNS